MIWLTFRRIPRIGARAGKNIDEDIQTARIDRREVDKAFGLKLMGIDGTITGVLEDLEQIE